jgi:hypothetical protein
LTVDDLMELPQSENISPLQAGQYSEQEETMVAGGISSSRIEFVEDA